MIEPLLLCSFWWGPDSSGAAPGGGGPSNLVLFLACFLTSAFASQRGLHTLFLAWFQVKGVTLDLLNDVFLLYLALEAAQRILEGFPLLKSDFRQTTHPQTCPVGPDIYCKVLILSQGLRSKILDRTPVSDRNCLGKLILRR